MKRDVKPWGLVAAFVLIWFPLACVVTVLCGLVYAGVQQDLRQTADDPQIGMAEDTAAALAAGRTASALVPAAPVDLTASLAPFLMIFDDQGRLVAGSAVLQGVPPTLPPGVFAYVRSNGEDRLTWAPAPGVREAAVVTRVTGAAPGFVLAARSLREVERREDSIRSLAALFWLAGLAATAVGSAALAWAWRRSHPDTSPP